jgi:prevent-host-death family protein
MGIEEARAKLGDLVIDAQHGSPTHITRNGKPAAVIVSTEWHQGAFAPAPGLDERDAPFTFNIVMGYTRQHYNQAWQAAIGSLRPEPADPERAARGHYRLGQRGERILAVMARSLPPEFRSGQSTAQSLEIVAAEGRQAAEAMLRAGFRAGTAGKEIRHKDGDPAIARMEQDIYGRAFKHAPGTAETTTEET